MTIELDIRFLLLASWSACLGQRNAKRLEDRLEHVVRIGSVDQAQVKRQRRTLDELLQERRDDIGPHAPEARARKIDVRYEQRLDADLEGDMRERFRGGHDRGSMAADACGAQRLRERLPECASRGPHFFFCVSERNLEREIERRIGHQDAEQVIQHGDARRNVRASVPGHRQTYLRARFLSSIGGGHSSASVAKRCRFNSSADRPL